MAEKEFLKIEDLAGRKHVEEYDASENAFDRMPIPQPGLKQVKIGYSDREEGYIQVVKDKESGELRGYLLHLTATVLKPNGDKDAIYNVYWSTTVRRGRKTSEISTILADLGILKGVVKVSHEKLVDTLCKRINKGLILWNEVDWRGSIKVGDKYEDVCRSKNEFEKGKDGKYKERMTVTRRGETFEVMAQIQPKGWWVNQPELKEDDEDSIDSGEVEEMVDEVEEKPKGKKKEESPKVKGTSKKKEEEEELEDIDDDGDEEEGIEED